MHTDQAIRQRRTEKVLADLPLPINDTSKTLTELIELAGHAPFHKACEEQHRQNDMNGIEPWRLHILDASNCRRLVPRLPQENAGKIPSMLNAADALILATWLPHQGPEIALGDEPGFAMNLTNVEHIAAASAAIQNLLLAATARNIRNYWSSGGVLRSPSVFEMLGIPTNQRLLGAIFLFPRDFTDAELATSKLRELRTSAQHWSRWVSLQELG